MKIKLFNLLAIAVVLSMLFAAAGVQPVLAKRPDVKDLKPAEAVLVGSSNAVKGAAGERVVYIVKLADPPVAAYRGGIAGYEATSIAITGEAKLNAKSAAALAYASYLEGKQAEFISAMEQALGRSVEITHRYKLSYNGMAAKMTAAEAAQVAKLPGVAKVMPDWVEYAQTDYGPQWIGADDIWPDTMGEGIVIAVVDTGINADHPSFADIGGDGYDHTNPTGKFWGWCDPGDPAYDPTVVCNDKLIGQWSGDADPPEDYHMHGSHVSSIAAGNWLDITVQGNTTTYNPTIHGVAPHANLIAFNIEGTPGTGSAPGSNIIAATEAIIDYGVVDVVNYSFGGGPADPWDTAEHWLNVRDAGVFVATSAGNNPPTPLVGSPANAPWMLSVGNLTHNRVQRTSLINMSGGDTAPPADILGAGFTAGYGPAPIVYAGDYPNPNDPGGDPAQCMEPYPAGTFSGEIVVCDRGTIARVDKGAHVLAGGAGGFVLANVAANGESINDDDHYLPATHIGFTDAEVLRAWLASGSGHTATISPYVTDLNPANGDVMASGSSRGPNYTLDILKPDVAAPGTGILGAENSEGNPKPPPEFGFHGGTSMASPHAAGAAALIRALHPDWTPAEIQSALTSTARSGVRDSDFVSPATPFDTGAGSVEVSSAVHAGLVLDETTTNFEDANPALGGDPTTLNLATLADSQCLGTCQWTREVRSSTGAPVHWDVVADPAPGMAISVTPASFDLDPGDTQEILIEVDASALTVDQWAFASVTFVPTIIPPTSQRAAAPVPADEVAAKEAELAKLDPNASKNILAPNALISYSGTNVGGPQWDRPIGGTCTISGLGPVRYHEYSFVAAGTGYYDIASVQDYDGYLHLYHTAFNPLDQCTNLMAGDDDGPGGIGTSLIEGVWLEAGTTYYVITSAWGAGDEGTFDNTIDGPITVVEAHFPIAVMPTSGILPDLVEINTRRNAGSQLAEDLQSFEITDLTVVEYGLTQAQLDSRLLWEDPTNGDPYDNLNDGTTFYVTRVVPAGAKRLVAEIAESEAPDIDLFVGLDTGDGVPQAGELVCSSTTPSWNEACDLADPAPGTYWVLVQNWNGSASQPDHVVLASAVVPGSDAGNMNVTGPAAVPELTPFDVQVFWDTPAMMAGDRWYGAFSLGTDPAHPGNIGFIPVNIIRHDDDVTKTVDQPHIRGDGHYVLNYTITVQPNVTPEDLTYYLEDNFPPGLTYVPGSASATDGVVGVVGNTLTWTGLMPTAVGAMGKYNMTTSDTDPMCDTGFGGYVDLELFGIYTQAGLTGDTQWWLAFTGQNPIEFYDRPYAGINFTDDGFAFFDSTPGSAPWINQDLPDPAEPNDLMALLWADHEIFYDGPSNQGISLANAGPEVSIIEYDDPEPWLGGTPRGDFEVVVYSTIDNTPGFYELVFAYDNLNNLPGDATIGVENHDATAYTEYLYGDPAPALHDGLMICFDYEAPTFPPVEITYQLEVTDAGCDVTFGNVLHHDTDNPGSLEETLGVDVYAQCVWYNYLPFIWKDHPNVGP